MRVCVSGAFPERKKNHLKENKRARERPLQCRRELSLSAPLMPPRPPLAARLRPHPHPSRSTFRDDPRHRDILR